MLIDIARMLKKRSHEPIGGTGSPLTLITLNYSSTNRSGEGIVSNNKITKQKAIRDDTQMINRQLEFLRKISELIHINLSRLITELFKIA